MRPRTHDRPHRSCWPWLAPIFALTLLLAACGDDDDDASAEPTTTEDVDSASPEDAGGEDDAEAPDDAATPDDAPDEEPADDGGSPDDDDEVVTGTDGCDSEAVDTANWSALAAGAEEGEFGASGASAGFQNLDRAGDGIGSISLIQRGRAEVILHMPIEVLAEGGTFDLAESLPGLAANAVLLAEFEAPVQGTVEVCVADNGGVNGVFEVMATSVRDDETVVMQGEFNGLKLAE